VTCLSSFYIVILRRTNMLVDFPTFGGVVRVFLDDHVRHALLARPGMPLVALRHNSKSRKTVGRYRAQLSAGDVTVPLVDYFHLPSHLALLFARRKKATTLIASGAAGPW
jgi:hypothetical protein